MMNQTHWTVKLEASLSIPEIDAIPVEIDAEVTEPYLRPFEPFVQWEATIPMHMEYAV